MLDFLGSWLRRHRRDTESLLKSATRFGQIEVLTNTVHVLIPDWDQTAESPEGSILGETIARTLANETWRDLLTILRLSNHFSDGMVREVAVQTAGNLFESFDVWTSPRFVGAGKGEYPIL